MTTTIDQLVAAATAAKTTLTAAQRATVTARIAWRAATTSCGIDGYGSHRMPGRTHTLSTPITVVPSPMPDFATLALNYTTAIVAENLAQAAYTTAKVALNAALAGT